MERDTNILNTSLMHVFFSFSIITLSVVGMIYFDYIILPLVIALFVWYIFYDLRRRMGKIRINGRSLPRWLRGTLSLITIGLIFVTIFEVLSINIEQISQRGPEYRENLDGFVASISQQINNPRILEYMKDALDKINIGSLAAGLVNTLSGFVSNFAVVLVYVIFMVLEEAAFRMKKNQLFPTKTNQYQQIKDSVAKIDKAVQAYMSSMIVISFLTAAISYIALLILGVDFPVLWAFLIFVLNFIPYIGPFISSTLPAILTVFQFGDLIYFVYVFVILEAIQIILGSFVQPKMMGKSMNISPLTVLLALAFWGSIWGVVGMILAVPMASTVIIILAQFPATRPWAILMSEKGDLGN